MRTNVTRERREAPAITKELAGSYITYHETGAFDSKGNCRAWRENGALQTWKRKGNEGRFRRPVKHGLYDYGAIDEHNAAYFHVEETCPYVSEAEREVARNRRLTWEEREKATAVFNADRKAGRIVWDSVTRSWRNVADGLPYVRPEWETF